MDQPALNWWSSIFLSVWVVVCSLLPSSLTGRVLLSSYRLGQVWISGTTGDIPCNKEAGQSQFSTPFDYLLHTNQSNPFLFPNLGVFLYRFPTNFFLCFFLSRGADHLVRYYCDAYSLSLLIISLSSPIPKVTPLPDEIAGS